MATKKRTLARAKPIVVISAEPVASVPEEPATVPEEPATVPAVTVGSLQAGDQFEYDGERYRRLFHTASKVAALHLTNPEKGWIGVTQTAFDRSTMVIKK